MKEYSNTEEENIHSDVSSTESESNSDTQYYCFNVNDDAYQVKDNNLGKYINDWMQQSNQLIINRKKRTMHAFHRKGPYQEHAGRKVTILNVCLGNLKRPSRPD